MSVLKALLRIGKKKVLPRFELGLLDSKSKVLTITPQDRVVYLRSKNNNCLSNLQNPFIFLFYFILTFMSIYKIVHIQIIISEGSPKIFQGFSIRSLALIASNLIQQVCDKQILGSDLLDPIFIHAITFDDNFIINIEYSRSISQFIASCGK